MTQGDMIAEAIRRALTIVDDRRHLEHSGRERIDLASGDWGELEVATRRRALRELEAMVGRRHLPKTLGSRLTAPVRADLERLDAEASTDLGSWNQHLTRYTRRSTSGAVLRAATARRASRASATSRALAEGRLRAFDGSDNDLRVLLHTAQGPGRLTLLTDMLLQLRALRRSNMPVDAKQRGVDDNSQGRLSTSGVLAALEQLVACKTPPRDGRQWALWRACLVNAPHRQPGTIYEASNLTLALLGKDDRGVLGHSFLPIYDAVHTLYTADTGAKIRTYVHAQLAPRLPVEQAVPLLSACVEALSAPGDPARHRAVIRLASSYGIEIRANHPEHLWRFLLSHCQNAGLRRAAPATRLITYQRLLALDATVNVGAPSATTLRRDLLLAGHAAPALAAFIAALESTETSAILAAAGPCRAALARAFARGAPHRRVDLLGLDRDCEHLLAQHLGDTLTAEPSRATSRLHAVALAAALAGLVASGWHHFADEPQLFVRLARAATHGPLDPTTLSRLREALATLLDTLRHHFRQREVAIHFAGIEVLLDPRFVDRLVKETSLHALVELASLTPNRRFTRRAGVQVRVIVAAGRAHFAGLVHVDRRGEAIVACRRQPPLGTLPVAAALLFEEASVPPGYSHLAVLARERRVGLFACADLAAARRYLRRARHLVLTSDHRLVAAPSPTRASGRASITVPPEARRTARPTGPSTARPTGRSAGVSTGRPISNPDLSSRAPRHLSLDHLGELPLAQRRALAGEKAVVLAELRHQLPSGTSDAQIPGGRVLTFAGVAALLDAVELRQAWLGATWDKTSGLATTLRRRLGVLLLGPSRRRPAPTTAGLTLLRQLGVSFSRPATFILRSAGNAEDLPWASAAGVYRSRAGITDAPAALDALIDILTSFLGQNARAHAEHLGLAPGAVWPALLVQRDLGARSANGHPTLLTSGVAISRSPEGGVGIVSYQAVRGAGGAVRGGRAEEGVVSPIDHRVLRGVPGLLPTPRARQLGRTVLGIERLFDRVLEPGRGHAVDVEWLFVGARLWVVQARCFASAPAIGHGFSAFARRI